MEEYDFVKMRSQVHDCQIEAIGFTLAHVANRLRELTALAEVQHRTIALMEKRLFPESAKPDSGDPGASAG